MDREPEYRRGRESHTKTILIAVAIVVGAFVASTSSLKDFSGLKDKIYEYAKNLPIEVHEDGSSGRDAADLNPASRVSLPKVSLASVEKKKEYLLSAQQELKDLQAAVESFSNGCSGCVTMEELNKIREDCNREKCATEVWSARMTELKKSRENTGDMMGRCSYCRQVVLKEQQIQRLNADINELQAGEPKQGFKSFEERAKEIVKGDKN